MTGNSAISSFLQMKLLLFDRVTAEHAPNVAQPECTIVTCVVTLTSIIVLVEGTARVLSFLSKRYPSFFDDSLRWWDEEENEDERASRIARSLKSRTWSSRQEAAERDVSCAICLNDFQENETIVVASKRCCNNVFHKECLTAWLKVQTSCPYCRSDILCHIPSSRPPVIKAGFSRY
jgi:Ring finger domain